MASSPDVARALGEFSGDPQRAASLAETLGFQPSQSPADLLAGRITPLKRFLQNRTDWYGVKELYRVGTLEARPASAGLYVAVLSNWGKRSVDRDRARRRVARALMELPPFGEARAMFILVPNELQRHHHEAEFVLPRSATDVGSAKRASSISTVRALVDWDNPTRFHRELLRKLAVEPGISLHELSHKWQQEFSVERVTREFYQQYMKLRNRIAETLLAANPEHPVIRGLDEDTRRAWATRQLGRMLFLWFLQSKRWLGYNAAGVGSPQYLLSLWEQKRASVQGGFYAGILMPLFFEAMAERRPKPATIDLLGNTPYLNGGLFRPDELEDRIQSGGKVTLPDDLFDPEKSNPRSENGLSVLGLLSHYHFTTRESTPDDQSVDPDPELLGRVFENLYQGDERHNTGTYYTPREIVHFMCREALDGYLRDRAEVKQTGIDWLRGQVNDPEEGSLQLDATALDRVSAALDMVRVCDPAVGSGAFLVGMMQEIVHLRRGILHAQGRYLEPEVEAKEVAEWKRRAIQWSLYGVDINPEAVEICRLRLWLSLVLEQLDVTTVDPLPNLDFRIVAGDSLVDRVAEIAFKESLPPGSFQPDFALGQKVQREEEQIGRWRQEFDATHDNPRRLRELARSISQGQLRIVRYHLESEQERAQREAKLQGPPRLAASSRSRNTANAAQRQVSYLQALLDGLNENAPYQKPFLWPVAFPDVFRDGGFDLVLANPPYVRQERLTANDQRSYQHAYSEVFNGTADLYAFFYARATQILRQGGWLAYITSNSFIKRSYGELLKKFLGSNLEIFRAIDFGELKIFDATVEPYVIVGRRTAPSESHVVQGHQLYAPVLRRLEQGKRSVEATREAIQDLSALLTEDQSSIAQGLFVSTGWRLEDQAVLDLLNYIRTNGRPLEQIVGGADSIHFGIKTSRNDAFIVDQDVYQMLRDQHRSANDVLRPWLRGEDIGRWVSDWHGLFILLIPSSDNASWPWSSAGTEKEAFEIFQAAYPSVAAWLSKPEFHRRKGKSPAIRDRSDKGRFWWELRSCTYYDIFIKPRICWQFLSRRHKYAWIGEEAYSSQNTFSMRNAPKWLLAVLNSRLMWFFHGVRNSTVPGSLAATGKEQVVQFPIAMPSSSQILDLERRVLILLNGPTSNIIEQVEEEIESIVYKIYGIDDAHSQIIRNWFERRSVLHPSSDEGVDDDN